MAWTGKAMMTATDPKVSAPRRHLQFRVAACLLIVATVGAVAASCSSTKAIDRLTIVNRTEFDVEVQVSDAKKESWQILGRADHQSSTVNEIVTDEGATWVFQFHYGGKLVGERTVKRETLARNDWRVEVPASVARTMRRLGFEPPPDR